MRRALPLVIFLALAGVLALGLTRDPTLIPSPLLGKAAPDFSLPQLRVPERQLRLADVKGQVALLNVWASWCASCRQEHGMLLEIARSGAVPLYGLNYKDQREDAIRWLERLGDPYVATGFDADGRVGVDFGVYGAPETYVLAADGTVVFKHIGAITREVWEGRIFPLVRELQEHKG